MPHRSRAPDSRISKNTAVRQALLRPSARQRSRWQRESRQRRLVYLLAGTLSAVVLGILAYGYWRQNVAIGNESVATVYDTTITVNDLVPWVKPRLQGIQQTMQFYQSQGLDQQVSQLQLQAFRVPDSALDQQVESLVIKREADRRGITVADSEVDEKLHDQMAEEAAANAPPPTATATPVGYVAPTTTVAAGGTADVQSTPAAGAAAPSAQPAATSGATILATQTATPAGTATPESSPTPVPTLSPDTFKIQYQAFLNRTGYADQQYRQLTHDDLLKKKLSDAIGTTIPTVQEQIHARQIQVANNDQAQDVLNKLQQGEKFEDLARSLSTDGTSKDKGGDLGWLPRGIQNESWDSAAFALQPGQRSGIVQLPARGAAIIEVLERDPARPVSETQLTALRNEAFDNWLSGAKADPAVKSETLTSEQRDYVVRKAGGPKLS